MRLNMKERHRVEQLLERYMAGDTGSKEEAELRCYFERHGNNIPDEWRAYRAMFAFVDIEQRRVHSLSATVTRPTQHVRRYVTIAAAAVAAVVIVLAGISGWHGRSVQGCYVIVDGKVYTNQAMVEAEALEALQAVSVDQDDCFGALDMMK